MQITITKRRMFAAILTMIFLIALFMAAFQVLNNRTPYDESVKLESGWTVTLPSGQIVKNANFTTFTYPPAQKGDIVIIENQLPDHTFQDPMLRIWMCHSAFQVFVDGNMIYEYAVDRYNTGQLIGTGYHWIDLPSNCAGSDLKIVFYVNEYDAISNFDVPILGEAKDAMPDFFSETFLSGCAAIFLLVFGIALLVTSIFMMFFSKGFSQLIYTGVFSIFIGLWTLCNKGVVQLISDNRILNMYCEYFSLYLGPIPMMLYVNSIRRNETRHKFKLIHLMILFNFLLALVTLILHVNGITHMSNMIRYYHFFDAFLVIYLIISGIHYMRRGKTDEKLLLLGLILLASCFAYDLIIFNTAKYINGALSHLMGISAWGGIAFIIYMLFSYATYVYNGIANHIEKKTLLKLAYSDELTDLANRTRFMEELTKFSDDQIAYTLICFDLNDLKQSNDTLGHRNGDLLLCTFADILNDTFSSSNCIISRIGGDEFNILRKGCDHALITRLMKYYQHRVRIENQRNHPFQVSAAWGIAYSEELPGSDYTRILHLADQRMYDKKAAMKESD